MNDGGPAFPQQVIETFRMRDYLAIHATDQDIEWVGEGRERAGLPAESRCTLRYRWADAMLAEREKEKP